MLRPTPPMPAIYRLSRLMQPVALYTAEANEAHRLMDEAGVPRIVNGEAASLSQRVKELTIMLHLAVQRR